MIILLGYLWIGCFVDIAILLHDLIFFKADNESYKSAYTNDTIKTQLLYFIWFTLLWPLVVVTLILYYTNAKFRAFVNEYSRQKRSKGE